MTQESISHSDLPSESESPVSGGSSSAKKSDDSNRLLVIQQNNELEKRLAFEISRFNTAKKSTPNLGMFSVCIRLFLPIFRIVRSYFLSKDHLTQWIHGIFSFPNSDCSNKVIK